SFGQPLELDFLIECYQAVRHLIVGIAFETQDGTRVLTLDTDIGHRPFEVQPGKCKIRVGIAKNPLHPGSYNLGVAVFSQSELLDGLANIANWNVESGPNDIVGNRGYGACRLPVTVSVG